MCNREKQPNSKYISENANYSNDENMHETECANPQSTEYEEDCSDSSSFLTKEDISNLLIGATTHPGLIPDFLHIAHILFSAFNLLERCSNVRSFHLERKIKKLSIKNNISNLTVDDYALIQNDDAQERAQHNGRIEYIDSVYEEGYDMLNNLIALVNVELNDIYKNHPEIDDVIMYNIQQYALCIINAIATTFGYVITTNSEDENW